MTILLMNETHYLFGEINSGCGIITGSETFGSSQ